jgi:hypothetical protein
MLCDGVYLRVTCNKCGSSHVDVLC